jgi:putative copper export protein
VVLAVAAFGWWNWRRVTPRLARAGAGTDVLRRSMVRELILAAVVLAVTAALVITIPPPTSP